jgi:hypothetical protein
MKNGKIKNSFFLKRGVMSIPLSVHVRDLIAQHGWMVAKVGDQGVMFAYTVGLTETLGHPELIMTGLDPNVAQSILNMAGDRIEKGESLIPYSSEGAESVLFVDGLFGGGYRAAVQRVSPSQRDHRMGVAKVHYEARGQDWEALQIIMPDAKGRFPWQLGYAFPGQDLLYQERTLE